MIEEQEKTMQPDEIADKLLDLGLHKTDIKLVGGLIDCLYKQQVNAYKLQVQINELREEVSCLRKQVYDLSV